MKTGSTGLSRRKHTLQFSPDLTDDRPFDSVPVPPDLQSGWTVKQAEGAEVAAAEELEYRVFTDAGFCERSPKRRVPDFEKWRDYSSFQVAVDPNGEVCGTVRTMIGDYEHLPVGSFERELEYPADPVLEYASLALDPDHRGTGVSEALYRAVWSQAVRHNAGGLVAIAETWLLDLLNDVYNFGFVQLGPSRWYMGGECLPIGTALAPLLERFKRQPTFFAWFSSELDLRDLTESDLRRTVTDARVTSED